MGIDLRTGDGIAEVVMDFPPVNALPVQGWFDLAGAVAAAGADPAVRAVIVAAEGRGFCAGVDIKEMQRAPGLALRPFGEADQRSASMSSQLGLPSHTT